VRILFVLDTWSLIGGTERHAAVVIPGLIERGHEVTVLCRAGDGAELPDVPAVALPWLAGERLDAAQRAELAEEVRRIAPDVVFVSAMRNVDALETLIDAAPSVRYVHDHTLFCPGLNKVYEDGGTCRHALGFKCLTRCWLDGGCVCFKPALHAQPVDAWKGLRAKLREVRVTRRSARVLTNSRYMREQLVLAGFDRDTTSVLHPFTAANTAASPRGPLPDELERWLDADAPLIFTPARLTLPDKGVDYLLSALGRLDRDFRAVVCGDGPAREWLEQKARDEGVAERVFFTGWLPSGPIETLHARADVVVCPSVWDEPFGLVGIEAMAHAKPVVAFDVGGVPDWLDDGATGLLVPRCDAHAMADAIERLLADAALRARLGTRGARSVEERFRGGVHLDGLERALAAALGC
jgi:glycosyltransferase involved in cell wall biosynthesis